jgi:hypothetical protein
MTATPKPDSYDIVRLSLNIAPELADTLKDYAARKGVTNTEAVRRALSVLAYVDATQGRGAASHVREPDGTLREVVFLA